MRSLLRLAPVVVALTLLPAPAADADDLKNILDGLRLLGHKGAKDFEIRGDVQRASSCKPLIASRHRLVFAGRTATGPVEFGADINRDWTFNLRRTAESGDYVVRIVDDHLGKDRLTKAIALVDNPTYLHLTIACPEQDAGDGTGK
jgi:hypothetical protein